MNRSRRGMPLTAAEIYSYEDFCEDRERDIDLLYELDRYEDEDEPME